MKTSLTSLTSLPLLLRLTILTTLLTSSWRSATAEDSPPEVKATAKSTETKIDPRVAARSVSIEAAEKLIASRKDLVILDVRTEREFAAGHLIGAVNVNSRAEDFKDQLGKLDTSRAYLVHSAGGGSRVTKTLELFEGLGFTNWFNLAGGFSGWTNAAKPIVK